MKTKIFLRVLSMVLCLLTLVAVFAACGDTNNDDSTTTTKKPTGPSVGPGEETELPTDENGYVLDLIPEELDYGGTQVKMLIWSAGKDFIFPNEVEGESIKNDIYLSNKEVEAELGLKFDVAFKSSHMSSGDDGQELYNAVLNRDDDYEAVCCYSLYPAMLAMEGVCHDLNATDFPMSEMPWYPADAWEWEIRDRLFFIANNSSIRNIIANWVVYVNNTMLSNKGIANIEETVLNGEWTLAKMKEYSRMWLSDAQSNTDDIGDASNVYGLGIVHRTAMDAFFYAAGFKTFERDENGDPTYTYFTKTNLELISGFCDVIVDLAKSPEVAVGPYSGGSYSGLKNRNTAMFVAALDQYSLIQNNAEYTIVVMPKLDEDPDVPYRTVQNNAFDVWCIPSTATDPAMGGVIIEALSSRDYRTIAPKWFDNDFKYRYSSSDNGVKIFDLIRSSFVADFGRMYMSSVGSPFGALRNVMHAGGDKPTLENNFATEIGGSKVTQLTKLEQLKTLVETLFPDEEA